MGLVGLVLFSQNELQPFRLFLCALGIGDFGRVADRELLATVVAAYRAHGGKSRSLRPLLALPDSHSGHWYLAGGSPLPFYCAVRNSLHQFSSAALFEHSLSTLQPGGEDTWETWDHGRRAGTGKTSTSAESGSHARSRNPGTDLRDFFHLHDPCNKTAGVAAPAG